MNTNMHVLHTECESHWFESGHCRFFCILWDLPTVQKHAVDFRLFGDFELTFGVRI